MSRPLRFEGRDESPGEIPQTPSAESGIATAEAGPPSGGIREAPTTDTPEGYKLTDVGVIPKDWGVRSLRSMLAEPPSYGLNAPAIPFDSSLPTYIRITDISEDGRFRPTPRVSVNGARDALCFLRPGDLVLARTGASVGKAYLYDPQDGPLVFAGFLIRMAPDSSRLRSEYLAQYLQTRRYWDWVANNSARSGQPGINALEYGSLPVPLPPLPEQRAIAGVLMDVDALIGSLEALIAKKRSIKQAAMQQLLTGRTRLPGFSGQWKNVALDAVATRTAGHWGAGQPSNQTPYPIRVVGAGDISPRGRLLGFSDRYFSQTQVSTASCAIGDIVITSSGNGLGKTWLVDRPGMAGSNFVRVLRANRNRADGCYLAYSLRSHRAHERLIEHTATSAYPNLLPSFFADSWIPLPPYLEQRSIAAVLSDMDAQIAALERRLAKTRAVKQGMMQQLLTGSIRLPIPDAIGEDGPGQ